MESEHIVGEEQTKSIDITSLRKAIRQGRLEWRKHVLQRLAERGISQKSVLAVLLSGERIEDDPDDKPFPALYFSDLFLENHCMSLQLTMKLKTSSS